MNKSNSFWNLFIANFKIMFRNYRGIFFNLLLPIFLYITIIKLSGFLGDSNDPNHYYANYLLPGLIAMTAMQTGIFSVSYWLIDLRAKGALKRFLVTPLAPIEMVGSVVASRLILIIGQVTLLTVMGLVFFHAQILGNLFAIIVLLALGGAVFLSIGFLISNVANNYEEAAPITTIVNLLFTFLGNIFYSSQNFPTILKSISNALPITFMAEGIRKNFLDTNWTFVKSLPAMAGLLVWLIVLLSLNALVFKKKED